MNVIVNNLLVNYTRRGIGKPILLLHGWGDRLETFDNLVKQLEDAYELISLDLAGFGKSQAPANTWGLEDYAQQVKLFLKKIDVQPYVIIGHSNGGAIAIEGLSTHELSAAKLILLASAGVRLPAKGRKLALGMLARSGKVATSFLPKQTRNALQQKLYKAVGSDLLVAPGMKQTFKRIVTQDIQNDAAKLSLPTIIFNGDQDDATPLSFAKILHSRIKKSELIVLPGADHFLHQSRTDEIAIKLRKFLSDD